ncbi:hydroxyacid dehydrogenase [Desulfovibrio sp. OttesenSCG-928-O18]|nr:hydroxyacid dehydrogenase [Desulfovibrio sp. OttesenSCG-928-O18]
MKTVVFSQALHASAMKALEGKANVVVANSKVTTDYLDTLKDAEAIVIRIGNVDRAVIEACPKLEVIARPGVGVDMIDVAAATEHGIPVIIAPGANTRSVAEHAVGLMYAITKNVVESHNETVKGNYDIRNKGVCVEQLGRRVGVAGFGAIGRETARLMKNNDLDVSVYDPYVSREAAEALGYRYESDLHAMLGSVDVLTLHLPSAPETRGMFGEKEFKAMKKGMFLVNCARGDLIDENAFLAAMRDGTVAAAGVDVMAAEPMDPKHPLFSLPNFIATPHTAAQTVESAIAVSKMVTDGMLAVFAGEKWPRVCNPEVYNHPRWKK